MNTDTFSQQLSAATVALLELTGQYCYNPLSSNCMYLIQPSGREVHDGMNELERINLKKINHRKNQLLTADDVIQLLSVDDKVPLWINTTVYESRDNLTVVHLFCSRRLRSDDELYHAAVKYPPFNILVSLPPALLKKEIDGKFDVNWKKISDDQQQSKGIFSAFKKLLARFKD